METYNNTDNLSRLNQGQTNIPDAKETPIKLPISSRIKPQTHASSDNITISNQGKLQMIAQIVQDWAANVNSETSSFTNPSATFLSGARLGGKLAEASKVLDQAFSREAKKMEDLSLKAAELVQKRKIGEAALNKNEIENTDEALDSFKSLMKSGTKVKKDNFTTKDILPEIEGVIGSLKNVNKGTTGHV